MKQNKMYFAHHKANVHKKSLVFCLKTQLFHHYYFVHHPAVAMINHKWQKLVTLIVSVPDEGFLMHSMCAFYTQAATVVDGMWVATTYKLLYYC